MGPGYVKGQAHRGPYKYRMLAVSLAAGWEVKAGDFSRRVGLSSRVSRR